MKSAKWDLGIASSWGVTAGGLVGLWGFSGESYMFGQTIGSMIVGGALFAAVAAIRNRLAK